MTQYQIIEISNQQVHLDSPHMALTPRVELIANAKTYTSTSDFTATLTTNASAARINFEAHGRLLTAAHQSLPTGDVHYNITYNLTPAIVEIITSCDATASFILPIIARQDQSVERVDAQTVRITKPSGVLVVSTDNPAGFDAVPKERTFNLVPGFECVPLTVPMSPGKEIRIQVEAALKT